MERSRAPLLSARKEVQGGRGGQKRGGLLSRLPSSSPLLPSPSVKFGWQLAALRCEIGRFRQAALAPSPERTKGREGRGGQLPIPSTPPPSPSKRISTPALHARTCCHFVFPANMSAYTQYADNGTPSNFYLRPSRSIRWPCFIAAVNELTFWSAVEILLGSCLWGYSDIVDIWTSWI